jgi:hypothetical protein
LFERIKNIPNVLKNRKEIKVYVNIINKILNEFFFTPVDNLVTFPFVLYFTTPCTKIFFNHVLLSYQLYYYPLLNDDFIQLLRFFRDINNEIYVLQTGDVKKVKVNKYSCAQIAL